LKKNQDAYVVIKNFLGLTENWFFGVFDGHGTKGHKVSHFVKKKLPEVIINNFVQENEQIFGTNGDVSQKNARKSSNEADFQETGENIMNFSNECNRQLVDGNLLSKFSVPKIKQVITNSILSVDEELGEEALSSGTTC